MDRGPVSSFDHLDRMMKASPVSAHGKLKIFLGMCPGVGKTCAMLKMARREHAAGTRIAVSVVETHGRPETEALLAGLPVIPGKDVEYRGLHLQEADIDAIIEYGPEIVLLDELAHTNAPGSRHEKRYQDVLELLDAGISVHTTLNVQHVESRNDIVARATNVIVREVVPDSVLDLADEIELVDISPDTLLERLREGKVYLGDRAARAEEHFFRPENLAALREMSLRLTAEHVSREVRTAAGSDSSIAPWMAGDTLLVAVGPAPGSERLIRLARRTAGALNAAWIVLHVDSGQVLGESQQRQLARNLEQAHRLGAEVVSIAGIDPVWTIIEEARRRGVTRILVGKPTNSPWMQRLFRRTLPDRLLKASGEIEIHFVQSEPPGRRPVVRPKRPAAGQACLEVLGLLGLAILAGTGVDALLGYLAVPYIFLAVLMVASLRYRRREVFLLAIGSALAWDFFFTEPRLAFAIHSGGDVLIMLLFFAVSMFCAGLVSRMRAHERAGTDGARRARALYNVTRSIIENADTRVGLEQALVGLEKAFNAVVRLFVSEGNVPQPMTIGLFSEKERSVALGLVGNRTWTGRGTDTLHDLNDTCIPVIAGEISLGVLLVRLPDGEEWQPLLRDLFNSVAGLFAFAISKELAQQKAQNVRLSIESHRLQQALLDNFSHEMRTPLAVISSALESLSNRTGVADSLLAEADRAAKRLTMVIMQIVNMTQLDNGLVRPDFEWVEAGDFLHEWRNGFGTEAERKRIVAGSAPSVFIQTDIYLLEIALSNIVQNALRYSPEEIPVNIEAQAASGYLTLVVTDQGPGVPVGEEEHIFERFYQPDSGRRGELGLGLAITRAFVELLGGTVRARSGSGGWFAIRLPCTTRIPLPGDHDG